jgi:membrane protein DedA with SNARE-associated domain
MRFLVVLAAVSGWTLVRHFGAVGLVLVGIVGDSPLPLPGAIDALTIVLSSAAPDWWPLYSALATTGSVIGGYLAYRVGRRGGKETLEKKVSAQRLQKVYHKFEKEGFSTVFVAALMPPPLPMTPFTIGAGAMNFPPRRFLAALAAGRAIRFTVVGLLGALFGQRVISFFGAYYRPALYALLALVAVGAVTLTVVLLRRKRRGSKRVRKAA